jgi:hypothetical protein
VTNPLTVGMTGHQGLPRPTAQLVAAALRDKLAGYGPNVVGVTMLGPGADQLFARIVLDLGGSLHIVVPAAKYRNGFEDQDARQGYDELAAKASHVEQLEYAESTEHAHMEGGKRVVDRGDMLIAVWDGQPSRGLGGTADVVAYAKQQGVPVEVIWPEGATRD